MEVSDGAESKRLAKLASHDFSPHDQKADQKIPGINPSEGLKMFVCCYFLNILNLPNGHYEPKVTD